ncbi:MAG: hypothetical protein Q8Q94_01325 [bacterium]|nr:hypothetical protein [bacterium]MDZ4299391.1 hypothetical protein [Candidatus Sungbacteria bacterium]
MAQPKTLLDDHNFLEFMVTAKQKTYASGGETRAIQLSHGGWMYTFNDERWPQWRFTDQWDGTGPLDNPFFGREMYFERTDEFGPFVPIAHMAYDGYALGDPRQVKKTFAFLESMLKRVDTTSLFRGPISNCLIEDGFEYRCYWNRRDPFRICGAERILFAEDPEDLTSGFRYQLDFQFCCLR